MSIGIRHNERMVAAFFNWHAEVHHEDVMGRADLARRVSWREHIPNEGLINKLFRAFLMGWREASNGQ